jgi:hypothetical protein
MVRGRIGIAGVSVAVVAAGLLTAGILAATPAGAAGTCASGECSNVVVTPPPAGTTGSITVTVTNETNETIKSVKVIAPSGFVVNGVAGGTAVFQNLSVPDNHSISLSVTVTAPCSATAGSAWTVQASETSPFTNPVDDFEPDSLSQLSAAVTGSCSLAFQDGQPPVVTGPVTTAPPGSAIPSVVGSSAAANPIVVSVLDATGQTITSSTAPITITASKYVSATQTIPVTLSGTTGSPAISGVASFANLAINQTGAGFQLTATTTSPGITPVTSSYFEILNDLKGCTGGSCTGSATTSTTTGLVTTSSASAGQFLGVGLGGVTVACGGSYQPVSDPLTFDVLNPSGTTSNANFTVTLSLSKKAVQSSGHPGASSWQVCFESDQPFTALPGTSESFTITNVTASGPEIVTYYTGLLPDCNNTATNAPCVLSRNKTNAGVEIVQFLGTGDSRGVM